MSAEALALPQTSPSNLRPFDLRRDLLAVADLVELCFADTLDTDGRLYIRQMRQAARSGPLVDLPGGRGDFPMGGFVWLDEGRLIGNLNLVPHRFGNRRLYLIANVAVHPEYRKRGIARALTQAALEEIERRGPRETWLQVDEKNETAVSLYRGMGFTEKMRRTSWRVQAQPELGAKLGSKAEARSRRAKDWTQQKIWLAHNYPDDVAWQLPLDLNLLQPGWRGAFERAFSERQVEQWSAIQDGRLLGVLSWQSSTLEADRLWLAADPEHEEEAIPALMGAAHAGLPAERSMALNYPSGRGVQALERSGFKAARTLIWMDYPWKV